MDNGQILAKIEELNQKIDRIEKSVNVTKSILIWSGVVMLALFLLPLIGLIFAIPSFLETYNQLLTI